MRAGRGVLLLLYSLIWITTAANADLSSQRSDFLAAEQAFKSHDLGRYRSLKAGLRDYPLLPYLEYRELNSQLKTLNKAEAEQFLDRYSDTPLARGFRWRWLKELARRQDWAGYLSFYRPTRDSTRRCLYIQALLKTGQTEQALDGVSALWLSGKSQPDACDPVFDRWRQAGRLSQALVWQRIALAMEKGNTSLARYLGRFLAAQEKPWLDRWVTIHDQPRKMLDEPFFSRQHPLRNTILLHGIERLARQDPEAAAEAWDNLNLHHDFDAVQQYRAQRALILARIGQDRPDLLSRLDRFTPGPDDESLHERRIRVALSRQAWPLVLSWVDALPASLQQNENWRYWRARALDETGQREQARELFRALARERSYHGFLAADRVEGPYNLEHQPLSIPPGQVKALASLKGFARAHELYYLGRLIDARREWRMATGDLTIPQLQAAAKLAQRWGWHSQAIFTLARTRYWDDLELRFPLDHQPQIERAASRQQLDKAWILAVIRQESAFSRDVVSRAGAIGLMQLMPATARGTARKIKRSKPSKKDLLIPATNIELGTAYLRMVYEQLDDNTVLAISAYNAGPHRVRRWLPEETLPTDVWIEIIPFKETRRYTQRVLTYSVIYDHRLGNQVAKLSERMPAAVPSKTLIALDDRSASPAL